VWVSFNVCFGSWLCENSEIEFADRKFVSILSIRKPRTILERELVVRLASLAWRLRRATAIEIGLLQMQAEAGQNGTDINAGAGCRLERFVLFVFCPH
jgi:hypothetical protein